MTHSLVGDHMNLVGGFEILWSPFFGFHVTLSFVNSNVWMVTLYCAINSGGRLAHYKRLSFNAFLSCSDS